MKTVSFETINLVFKMEDSMERLGIGAGFSYRVSPIRYATYLYVKSNTKKKWNVLETYDTIKSAVVEEIKNRESI